MSDQREGVEAAVYGALLDDENEGLDPLDLAVKIADTVLPALEAVWDEAVDAAIRAGDRDPITNPYRTPKETP